ncbi:MAG: hypothetical protein M1837_005768 [Sclerophora amabilis]|nr:MAG: hypothetical protein M1837_005768 [Sclerophora amabilis]
MKVSMFRWLNGPGSKFREPLAGSTNYLSAYDNDGNLKRAKKEREPKKGREAEDQQSAEDESGILEGIEQQEMRGEKNIAGSKELPPEGPQDLRPYPLNQAFRSQPVLSEELREEVYRRVVKMGRSVQVVSAELGVEMNRVGAVVRLKTIEKNWVEKGIPLNTVYNRAVLSMLPTTALNANQPRAHESINDLPTHPATLPQIFHPTSESRPFTRADAGRIFDDNLLPADARIPHPELIELERERNSGISRDERISRQRERGHAEREAKAKQEETRRKREERMVKKVKPAEEGGKGGRWEWRFREVRVDQDTVGKDGRGPAGVGARYGIPHEDRKKGLIKIPRSVV